MRELTTALLVVFVVLKLVGVIAWSWWWVTAPFWIPASVALVAIAVVAFWPGAVSAVPRSRRK